MRLRRRQSQIIAGAVLVLFFVVATLLARTNSEQNTQISLALPNATPTPTPEPVAPSEGSRFMLKDFHRSETRDGKTVWEVRATQGQFFPEEQQAKLREATIWVYRKNGDILQLRAKEALLKVQGAALLSAHASGGVVAIMNATTTLETESAVYDKDSNKIFAPGAVKIVNERAEQNGIGLEGNLETRAFKISKDV